MRVLLFSSSSDLEIVFFFDPTQSTTACKYVLQIFIDLGVMMRLRVGY